MDNIIIRNRKEEFKELVLYTVFGNMTFVISIGAYAIFNVFFGINELIANALAWVEYSCAITPQVRQAGNRLSGLTETAYASLLA